LVPLRPNRRERKCTPPPTNHSPRTTRLKSQCFTCWPGEGAGRCSPLADYARLTATEHGRVAGRAAIKAEVFARGPVSCSIDATAELDAFAGGVVFAQFLERAQSNHLVSVVGWGRVDPDDVDTEFWVVRSECGFKCKSKTNHPTKTEPTNPPIQPSLADSWGEPWGEGGFFRLPTSRARGGEGAAFNLGVEESCGWAAAGEWTPARDLGF
jgi:cathepsin X